MPPRSLRSGGLASVYSGDRSKREPGALTASVEWHLGASDESVNAFFQKFVTSA